MQDVIGCEMFDLQIAEPVAYAFLLLLNTSDVLSRYTEVQLSKLGITSTQFKVLMILQSCQEPPTLTELGQRLFRDKRGLTIVIDRMERDGLVKKEKDTADGRAIRVVATERGNGLFESAKLPSQEIVQHVMSCFSQDDMNQLSELLQRARVHTLQILADGNGKRERQFREVSSLVSEYA